MPRGKGGNREGANQTSYSNRTDLNDRGPKPITSAPGQQYGERQMQEDAQRAVPMGGTPIDVPSNLPPAPTEAPINTRPASGLPEPGTMPFLHPSDRPHEPVTQGINSDLGGSQRESLTTLLEAAASSQHATPEIAALAEFARLMGI